MGGKVEARQHAPIIDQRPGTNSTRHIVDYGGMRIPLTDDSEVVFGSKDTAPINQVAQEVPEVKGAMAGTEPTSVDPKNGHVNTTRVEHRAGEVISIFEPGIDMHDPKQHVGA